MRHANWETQLIQFLQQSAQRPFEWGIFDCCLFVSEAVTLINGMDLAKDFRGHYHTKIGAYRALKRIGSGTIDATFTQLLGEPVPMLLAHRGDVALVELNGEQLVAINYNGIWAVSMHGLVSISSSNVVHCWRVC